MICVLLLATTQYRSRRDKEKSSVADTDAVEKEIKKLKTQEERYNRAYGAGALTIEQLNFTDKRAIVVNVLEKVIATQQKLEVYGYVPVTSPYVKYKTDYRNSRIAQRRQVHPF